MKQHGNNILRSIGAAAVLVVGLTAALFGQTSQPVSHANLEFFESDIRPLLVERCYKCHSAQSTKLKGGLLLDSRDGLLSGGDTGPAIVPFHPERSLLIKAVQYNDEKLQMPPKEQLTRTQIASLEKWIRLGATDPRTGPATKPIQRDYWALQPIRVIPAGTVHDQAWPTNDIDRYVLAKLEESKLHPSPPATKPELLRRVTMDLTGLPPSPEDMANFLSDNAATAYEKVVDRLLASPRYGERWGRHWLDVVRFGESHGYEQNHLRDNAWPYRDYVIRAFNEDKPYTKFVEEQLAGDVVANGDPSIEVATGFLVAGVHDTVGNGAEAARRQQRADDLDDIVATVGATFMGLTVGCAKCHDHKFDPIPQADYYALSAVFAGVRHEERFIALPKSELQQRELKAIAEHAAQVQAELKSLEDQARASAPKADAPAKPLGLALNPRRNIDDFSPVTAKFVRLTVTATRDNSEPCIDELEVYAAAAGPNLALASAGATASASSLLPGFPIHQVSHLNDGLYGNDHSWISNERGQGWTQIELPQPAKISRVAWGRDNSATHTFQDRIVTRYRVDVSADAKAWTTVATSEEHAGSENAAPTLAFTSEQRQRHTQLLAELESLKKTVAGLQFTKAYIGGFNAPDPVYLLKRGDVMQRGDELSPTAFTRIPNLSGDLHLGPNVYESERRRALAHWICDERNPLPARVLVNRIWQYHFGRGLVGTPSDFGANGEAPSHPELLDWLATDFVKGGWRIKRLHRQIVLSQTYRQTGHPDDASLAAGLSADAGNRLLWRMPLRRLEAEAVRDSILFASGKLDLSPTAIGGPGFHLYKYKVVNIGIYESLPNQGPETFRRAVYQQTARNIHDELMAAFDEPENAQRAPRRELTTTPLQALTLFNAPFVLQQSNLLADRVRAESAQDPAAQITKAFHFAFGRPPTPIELQSATAIVQDHGLSTLCRALFNTNEFLTY